MTGLATATPAAGTADMADAARAVLVTMLLDGQLCGIPVDAVRDVLGEQAVTRIPLAPPAVAGSLNLRGRIVTAIDLRRRLGLPPAPAGGRRMWIVTERDGELYALLVDQVIEVVSLPIDRFAANPATLRPGWVRFSDGLYQLPDRLLAVLDVGRLLDLQATER